MQFYGKTLAKNLETRKKNRIYKTFSMFFCTYKNLTNIRKPFMFKKALKYTFCHVEYEKL